MFVTISNVIFLPYPSGKIHALQESGLIETGV